MSSHGSNDYPETNYCDYTLSSFYSYAPPRVGRFHSARIGITLSAAHLEQLRHETEGENKRVLFRSYKDGVRVGCTYISNDAIEFIYKKHKEFLDSKDFVEHQSGVD